MVNHPNRAKAKAITSHVCDQKTEGAADLVAPISPHPGFLDPIGLARAIGAPKAPFMKRLKRGIRELLEDFK